MSLIIATERYVTSDTYSVGDLVYVDITTLLVTNTLGNAVTDIGVIGELQEVPSDPAATPAERMVVRLSLTTARETPIKNLLQARSL